MFIFTLTLYIINNQIIKKLNLFKGPASYVAALILPIVALQWCVLQRFDIMSLGAVFSIFMLHTLLFFFYRFSPYIFTSRQGDDMYC